MPPPLGPNYANGATVATTGLDSKQVYQLLAVAAVEPIAAGGGDGAEGQLGDGQLLYWIAETAAALNVLNDGGSSEGD